MEIPDYIEKRLTDKPPKDCCVQEDTYPSVGSGRLEEARVVTVGINPKDGRSRPQTPTADDLTREWKFRMGFLQDPNKKAYHQQLEQVLNACHASFYKDASDCKEPYAHAASLDVAQWATNPSWSKLGEGVRAELLADGKPFLQAAIKKNRNIRLLLGNGKTVIHALRCHHSADIERRGTICVDQRKVHLFEGTALGKRFIGWNVFLSRVGTEMQAKIAERVCELYKELKA